MCLNNKQIQPSAFIQPVAKLPTSLFSSKRLRLWELPVSFHCPVIGVCLSTVKIRQLVNRFHQADKVPTDYECHSVCVHAAAHRNPLSEALQKELESRHQLAIQRLRNVKTSSEIETRWNDAVAKGDIAGVLWAALTHPRTTPATREGIYRDVHMLQHQAGASVRADQQAFDAQGRENTMLVRELGKIQTRMTAFANEKLAHIEALSEQLRQARHDAIQQTGAVSALKAECQHLREKLVVETPTKHHQFVLQRLETRGQALRKENTELRQELLRLQRAVPITLVRSGEVVGGNKEAREAPRLARKTVLCVGGRTSSISSYRETIEITGARFAHHDGGIEHHPRALDAGLAAADYVICQTGCISHDAYWRVKDYCKRHGKKCLYIENSSVTAFKRGLEQIEQMTTDHHKIDISLA